jgi:hypothetical protein
MFQSSGFSLLPQVSLGPTIVMLPLFGFTQEWIWAALPPCALTLDIFSAPKLINPARVMAIAVA